MGEGGGGGGSPCHPCGIYSWGQKLEKECLQEVTTVHHVWGVPAGLACLLSVRIKIMSHAYKKGLRFTRDDFLLGYLP